MAINKRKGEKSMKNRRIVVIAIVLAAVLCLGVGYALLTDDLSVTGNVGINHIESNDDFDADVCFDKSVVPSIKFVGADGNEGTGEDKVGVTAEIKKAENNDPDDLLHIIVPAGVLNFKGESIVVTATVVNNSTDFDAVIKSITGEGSVQDDAGLTDVTCVFANTTVAKGGSTTVTVTITLKETPTGDETMKNGDFSFAIGAEAVKPTT